MHATESYTVYVEHRRKNSYAMHTIKLLLTYCLNISVQAANLSDCRIESIRKNRFGSENRIESNRNFFARIGMLYSIHGTPYLTQNKSPVSEEEHHVKK